MPVNPQQVEVAIRLLLRGLDVELDEHTEGTPARVARAWEEMLAGYAGDPGEHLAHTFPGPEDPGLVVVAGIRLVSVCAHHLLPFSGAGTVAYRPQPGAGIVGLSKLVRVLLGYARRLQVQERIGADTTTAIMDRLKPHGAACLITAGHSCMGLRGITDPHAVTTTASWAGDWSPHDTDHVIAEHTRSY